MDVYGRVVVGLPDGVFVGKGRRCDRWCLGLKKEEKGWM